MVNAEQTWLAAFRTRQWNSEDNSALIHKYSLALQLCYIRIGDRGLTPWLTTSVHSIHENPLMRLNSPSRACPMSIPDSIVVARDRRGRILSECTPPSTTPELKERTKLPWGNNAVWYVAQVHTPRQVLCVLLCNTWGTIQHGEDLPALVCRD